MRCALYSHCQDDLLCDGCMGVAFRYPLTHSAEAAMALGFARPDTDHINDAERAFLEGVFACLYIQGLPTEAEFRQGLEVLSA